MLAIISDLHFCDGTATDENVKPDAFKLALEEIYDFARPLADNNRPPGADPPRLDLVLLGDVFDLLRTERWFEDADGTPVPLEQRPWGSPGALDPGFRVPEQVIVRARAILDAIIQRNAEALAVLKGDRDAELKRPKDLVVRRALLLGNHDRLALHDDRIFDGMRNAIGADDPQALAARGIFRHHLEMKEYGVLARHGHEWDPWNFESFDPKKKAADYGDDEYKAAPIGDPITTELAAKLPYLMKRGLRALDPQVLTPAEIEATYQHLQRIEDVRPLFASLQWALFTAARMPGASNLAPEKRAAIARTAKSVARALVEGFRALPFYEAWDAKHRHSFFSDLFHHDLVHNPAEQLHLVLQALDVFSPDTLDKVGNLFGKVLDDSSEGDPCRTGAGKEALDGVGGDGSRVVVYGHTHDPAYAPLAAGDATEDVYLNSGTFRKRIFRTDDGNGFVRSEHLTYLCFMSKEEAATMDKPSYAAWMGVRGAR